MPPPGATAALTKEPAYASSYTPKNGASPANSHRHPKRNGNSPRVDSRQAYLRALRPQESYELSQVVAKAGITPNEALDALCTGSLDLASGNAALPGNSGTSMQTLEAKVTGASVILYLVARRRDMQSEPARNIFTRDDTLGDYLAVIGRIPLLQPAEEVALGRIIQARMKAIEAAGSDGAAVSKDIMRYGEKASMLMTNANLKLVVSVANRYNSDWLKEHGMSLSDLVQDGNQGLMRACEKFDPERGFRFSTYATWWIMQAILRGIANETRIIRLPVHVNEKFSRLDKEARKLRQKNGAEPTLMELSEATGIPEKELAAMTASVVSLDEQLAMESDRDDLSLLDLIAAPEDYEPEPAVMESAGLENLRGLMADAKLTPNERYVLGRRHGLDDGIAKTLAEIGDEFGVTRERIRQIEAKGLSKLRNYVIREGLRREDF